MPPKWMPDPHQDVGDSLMTKICRPLRQRMGIGGGAGPEEPLAEGVDALPSLRAIGKGATSARSSRSENKKNFGSAPQNFEKPIGPEKMCQFMCRRSDHQVDPTNSESCMRWCNKPYPNGATQGGLDWYCNKASLLCVVSQKKTHPSDVFFQTLMARASRPCTRPPTRRPPPSSPP